MTKDEHVLYTSPAWTPEGDYVLVSRQPQQPFGAFELWMYHDGGGAGVQVTKGKLRPDAKRNEDYAHALGAVASHDGALLYYTRRPKLFNPYNNLRVPPLAGRPARPRRPATRTRSPTPRAAPSARPSRPTGPSSSTGPASTARPGCGSATWPSGEERWLKFPVQRDEQESLFTRDILPGYAFTPDGKAVIAVYGGKLHRIDVAGGEDRVIPFTGEGVAPGRLAAELPDPGR